MDELYCKTCNVRHKLDLFDVLAKGKKRVVCGQCMSVLMTEDQLEEFFIYMSDAGWWCTD
jgi:hypothetical protein